MTSRSKIILLCFTSLQETVYVYQIAQFGREIDQLSKSSVIHVVVGLQ